MDDLRNATDGRSQRTWFFDVAFESASLAWSASAATPSNMHPRTTPMTPKQTK